MSRKIEFRAFDTRDPAMGMLKVICIDWEGRANALEVEKANGDRYHGVIEQFILMQYIGINDRKGQPIYEGDIVLLAHGGLELRGRVKCCASGEWEVYKDESNHVGVHHNKDRIEIIGNIHEHPQLLEKGAKAWTS